LCCNVIAAPRSAFPVIRCRIKPSAKECFPVNRFPEVAATRPTRLIVHFGVTVALAMGVVLSPTALAARQQPVAVRPAPALAYAVLNGEDRARATEVDELFREWHTPDTPGGAVLVLRNGEVMHARGYGMASLEHGVPIRPNTVFDIASVSKQFGAMAIALLENEGRLSLDDDVRRYIPELPDFGSRITIRHLVHHTSGIRDWPGTLRMAGWDYQDVISFEQILRMAYHQRELNFPPGSEYAYSNTGYNLLAEIVQRVTGVRYAEWTRDHIFRPLGMHSTHFLDDHTAVIPNRAESYRRGADGVYHRVGNALTALSSSSLHTTVEDLARWSRNFEDPVVGGASVVARLHERGVLSGGDTIPYAFGQSLGTYRGLRTYSHTGSWAGFRTVLQRFPDERVTVIVLSNSADMNPSMLAQRIADIHLGHRMSEPAAVAASGAPGSTANTRSEWTPSDAELAAYAGRYHSAELMTSWELEVRDGRLVARHFRTGDVPLQPFARDRFRSPLFGEVVFLRDGDRVAAFTANSDRVRGLRFERLTGDGS
jgi:CubicO group peptidase (beta-lactamase class C family)